MDHEVAPEIVVADLTRLDDNAVLWDVAHARQPRNKVCCSTTIGWTNYAYRSLKADRDDRPLERRLDAAESVPWLLDVVFALAGRVRPYHKYLPWELREHPLPNWPSDVLLPLLERTLDGDPAAVRETFARVEVCCAAYDAAMGHNRTLTMIDSWGDELVPFRE